MNERPAPAEADARRWSYATLGVAEDASQDAVRAAFLKQIGEADFYPPADSLIAWQSLTGAAASNPRARRILSERVNDGLRTEVEQFAARFFSVGVTERVKQWFDLNSRCQSSAALTARLEGLSAGLHLDRQAVLASLPVAENATQETAPSERALAEKAFEIFVLRPVDRAERQQELLEAWQTDLQAWQTAARKFKKQLPKVAELDAEFIDTILDTPRPVPLAAATRSQYPVANFEPAATGSGRSWPMSVGIYLLLGLCISAVSRCAQQNNRPSTQFVPPPARQSVDIIKRMVENQKGSQDLKPASEAPNDEQPIVIDASPLPFEPSPEKSQPETPEANDEAP